MSIFIKKTFLLSVCFVPLLVLMLANHHVKAQNPQPIWQQNLTCSPQNEKYQGITYCSATIANENKTTSIVHVIVIELNSPGIGFEYVLASGVNKAGDMEICQDVNRTEKGRIGCDDPNNPQYYPLIEFSDAATRFANTAVVITADYGAGDQNPPASRDHGPEGLTIVNGLRLDGTQMWDGDNAAVGRPWLAIGEKPGEEIKIGQLRTDTGEKPEAWMDTALGGAPWMIQNGIVYDGEIINCNAAAGSCYPGASQVAVGLSQDEDWMFLVVMEKPQPNLNDNPTPLLDLAYFMKDELGVYIAIKLDGGGSTKLRYGEEDIYIDSSRKLSQYLVVTAPPAVDQSVEEPNADTSQTGMVIDGFGMGSSTHLRVGIDPLDEYLSQQEEMGVRWIREEFPWGEIEPAEGNFRFQYVFGPQRRDFDLMLSKAAEHNINVMGVLVYGPIYLNQPGEEQLLSRWEEYVTAVVSRYGSQVDYWEIGNEVNSRFFWGKVVLPGSDLEAAPNPGLYAKMLSIAYDIIKRHDRNDVVVLGGLVTYPSANVECETNPFVFLKGIHDAGAWDKFDVIGFHPYWGNYPPEWPISRGLLHDADTGECLSGERTDTLIHEVRSLHHLAEQFGEKPIWITELGWDQAWLEYISNYPGAAPDQIQADYVARTYVPLLSEDGVEKIFWYTLVGDNRSENFVLGSAGQQAYHNLSELLTGSSPLGQFQGQNDRNQPEDDDVYEYRFQKGDRTIIVIWKARGGEAERDVVVSELSWEKLRSYPIDTTDLSRKAGTSVPVVEEKATIKLYEHPVILIGEKANWWDGVVDWWNEWSAADPLAWWDGVVGWWNEFSANPFAWFRNFWDQRVQDFQEAFNDWLQEQARVIWETIVQILNDAIEQMCGCRPIPVGLLAGFLFWRRRHKGA